MPGHGWDPDEPDGAGVDGDQAPVRSWLMPMLASIAALVLLSVLTVGVWTALNALRTDSRGRVPQPSAAPAAPQSADTTPAQVPETVASTSTAPSSQAPETVVIPHLVGMSQGAATEALTALGLQVLVVDRPAGTADEDTVLGTEPAEGSTVPKGASVSLLVARSGAGLPSTAPSGSRSVSPSPSR